LIYREIAAVVVSRFTPPQKVLSAAVIPGPRQLANHKRSHLKSDFREG